MRDRFVPLALVFALALAAALPAGAQELRGRITGVVTDNTGAVLPGVTVTAAGPALIQPQTTVTSDDGTYRYPALPPGLYTVSFELSGFQTLKREGIRLGLNQTLSVDAQLQLSSLQETVTITGESPIVDVKSTTVGTNFTKELLQDIPNARDIWAAMAQAPGFQMTGLRRRRIAHGDADRLSDLWRQRPEQDAVRRRQRHRGTGRERRLLRFRQLRGVPAWRLGQHGRAVGRRGVPESDREIGRRQLQFAGVLRLRRRADTLEQRSGCVQNARRR